MLFYPVTDANFETGSYNEFANGPWLTKTAMKWFWDAYLPDEAERKEPTASPLQAIARTAERPAAGAHHRRRERRAARRGRGLCAASSARPACEVTSLRYNGTIHDFVLLNAIAETPAVRSAIKIANETLRDAFAE